ncbi:hypothetical protein COB57_04240 [Candidatus Peregrinibacteria bacterium]|nr:MAG: hypothetical protein COB57_04240 [Candidatus Peregrinibacteria bacterium]
MFPVIFHIYGFEIPTYPVLLLFGVMISVFLFSKRVFEKELSLDFMSDHLLYFVFFVFLGARTGGVLFHYQVYREDWFEWINIFNGDYNFYFGVASFLLLFIFFAKRKGEDLWKWLDALSRIFILVFVFVACAEFAAGENYGTDSTLPWAVTHDSPDVRLTIPVHPVQLYEAILLLFVFIAMSWYEKKTTHEGDTFALSLFFYFFIGFILFVSDVRFVVSGSLFGYKYPLLFSLLFSVFFLVLFIWRTHTTPSILHEN